MSLWSVSLGCMSWRQIQTWVEKTQIPLVTLCVYCPRWPRQVAYDNDLRSIINLRSYDTLSTLTRYLPLKALVLPSILIRPLSLCTQAFQLGILMRLCHPPDGSTSPKYKLLCFITAKINCKEKNALAFNQDRCCHLVLCLRLIPFHYFCIYFPF